MNFNVNADLFRNVARAVAGPDSTRYYLQGVLVEPHPCGGVYLVATDGVHMIVAYDASGTTDGPHIAQAPRDLLRHTARKKARNMSAESARRIVADGDQVEVRDGPETIASLSLPAIEGNYPEWGRLIPRPQRGAMAAQNPEHVARMMDVALDLTACGWQHFSPRMMGEGDADPTLVLFGHDAPVFGIIMPMRSTDPAMPAFFGARPYETPSVELSAPIGHYPMNSEAFEVTTRRSPLHPPVTRRFVFNSKAAAARAFNRYRAALEARGVTGLPEPALPHSVITNAMLDERKRRVRAIDDAAAAFTEATDQDIAMPWRRALLPQTETRTVKRGRRTFTVTETVQPMHAVGGLPHLSEARLLATAYRLAA